MDDAQNESQGLPWLPGLILIIGVMLIATSIRLGQISVWEANPAVYQANSVPVLADADGYYFLRWARAYLDRSYQPEAPDERRHYQRRQEPDGQEAGWYPQLQPAHLPLLSRIAALVHQEIGWPLERVALYLPPLLASLFMVPLFLYFWRLGIPSAGLAGGLVGTFSLAYYMRSTAGWFDTDVLNLFFPFLGSYLILLMTADRTRGQLLVLALSGGLVMFVFWSWYQHASLTLAYAVTLVVYMLIQRVSKLTILFCLLIFLTAAHPVQLLDAWEQLQSGVGRYLGDSEPHILKSGAELVFPDIFSLMGETQRFSFEGVLALVMKNYLLSLVGLAGFVFLAARYWTRMVPLFPLLLLATLPFVSAQRFTMYLAPFIGVGLGYLFGAFLGVVVNELMPNVKNNRVLRAWFTQGVTLLVFFLWVYPLTGSQDHVPQPYTNASTVASYKTMQKQLGESAFVWTWWPSGYALADMGLSVYHDGGVQYTPQTFFVARSLISDDPQVLRNTIQYVHKNGVDGIEKVIRNSVTAKGFVKRIEKNPRQFAGENIYLLFDKDMIEAYGMMSYIGHWDFEEKQGQEIGYRDLNCDGLYEDALACKDIEVDLSLGVVGDDIFLRKVLLIENGEVVHTFDYYRDSGPYLQILVKDRQPVGVYLLRPEVFDSNFNQMFLLGLHDPARYEEVYLDFPESRAYRVLPGGGE